MWGRALLIGRRRLLAWALSSGSLFFRFSNTLEEFSKTSGITITYAQLLKEITLALLTPTALLKSVKGETISFLGAYNWASASCGEYQV